MSEVIQGNDGKYLIFWVARCRVTARELKFRSALPFFPMTDDVMREWVEKFFRNLELIEYRPWSEVEDAHRVQYPVPVQHVKFVVPKPDLAQPDARRKSLLISQPLSARPLGGRSLLSRGV